MVALCQRSLTGEGQHVDAPAYLSLAWASGAEVQGLWSVDQTIVKRSGGTWLRAQTGTSGADVKYIRLPLIYPCKDGNLRFMPFVETGMLPSTMGLTQWVIEEGEASETLKKVDWRTWNWQTVSQETVDGITQSFERFFLKHTKTELWEGAQKRGIQLYPLLTASDMLGFEQLRIRDYWEEVEHPELNASVSYPGAFVKMTEAPCRIRRRASLIGEHNEEIYLGELGMSPEELLVLKQARVI
jgi:crotonobetainyl-CoA:carnitine CoA-transferase CaiB-like acyl-CoA transferase